MDRIIPWSSGAMREIELVYEKAEKDDSIADLLEKLERQALAEARENGGLAIQGLTPSVFDTLSEEDREKVIVSLARLGLDSFSSKLENAVFRVRLSAVSPAVQACTFFDIINRIENLDGAVNLLIPKWTLELEAPLGGKKGLFQWEFLIMQLYPWISVSESSTNEPAAGRLVSVDDAPVQPQQKPAPAAPSADAPAKTEKKSFLKGLFGK